MLFRRLDEPWRLEYSVILIFFKSRMMTSYFRETSKTTILEKIQKNENNDRSCENNNNNCEINEDTTKY